MFLRPILKASFFSACVCNSGGMAFPPVHSYITGEMSSFALMIGPTILSSQWNFILLTAIGYFGTLYGIIHGTYEIDGHLARLHKLHMSAKCNTSFCNFQILDDLMDVERSCSHFLRQPLTGAEMLLKDHGCIKNVTVPVRTSVPGWLCVTNKIVLFFV